MSRKVKSRIPANISGLEHAQGTGSSGRKWFWAEVDKLDVLEPRFKTESYSKLLPEGLTMQSGAIPRFRIFIALSLNEAACRLGYGYFYHTLTGASPYGELFFVLKHWSERDKTEFKSKSHQERWADSSISNGRGRNCYPVIPITLWPRGEKGILFKEPYKEPKAPSSFKVHEKASFVLKYESYEGHYWFRPHLIPMSAIKTRFKINDQVDTTHPHLKSVVMLGRTAMNKHTDHTLSHSLHEDYKVASHSKLLESLRDIWLNGDTADTLLVDLMEIRSTGSGQAEVHFEKGSKHVLGGDGAEEYEDLEGDYEEDEV